MSHFKKTLLTCLTWTVVYSISFTNAVAQTKQTINKFYFQAGLGGGSFNSYFSDVSLQSVIKNKWALSLSYQSLEMKPNNIPADFIPATGTGEILFIPYSYVSDVDDITMNLVSLTGGRYFKFGRNTWSTTEAGISLVKADKVQFVPSEIRHETITNVLGWEEHTTSNYEMTTSKKTTMGAAVKADINWAFASFMGIGAGVWGNLNSIQSPVGFQVKLMIGYMGRVKKHKHH